MIDHVYRKFADQFESIQTLLQKDAAFAEMCADYEEICTWFEGRSRTSSPSTEEYDQARDLMRELEDEIAEALREA
jgi:uncharacterized protein YdcH (DUF465 family)